MVTAKAVRQALYAKLNVAAVTTLLDAGSASLFHAVAPPNSGFPFVIFNKQSGRPSPRTLTTELEDELWLVKGVTRGKKSGPAEDIAKAVDDALDLSTLSITGATSLYVARVSDVDYIETDDDDQYRHHGAVYRLVIESS